MKKTTVFILILLTVIIVVTVGWVVPDFRATLSDAFGGVWFVGTQALGGLLAGIAATPIWQNYGNFISAGIMVPVVAIIALKAHGIWNAITGAAMKKRINEFVPQGAPMTSAPVVTQQPVGSSTPVVQPVIEEKPKT